MKLNHLNVSTVKMIIELSKLARKTNDLINALRSLSPEQKKELCALMWLGRDEDENGKGLDKLIEETDRFRNESIEQYMIEKPLDDYLTKGLRKLGYII